MERSVKGDVVVIPFPVSDLTQSKRRPALVLAVPGRDDVILCQITSKAVSDSYAIPLSATDFETGSLKQQSNIRPNRIFTADQRIVLYTAGRLRSEKMTEVVDKVTEII